MLVCDEGLNHEGTLVILNPGDDNIKDLLALAHEVCLKQCGEGVKVEGIISLKTGGYPEDYHLCSQLGLFESPACSAWLGISALVDTARQIARPGTTEFYIVAVMKRPDERLLSQMEQTVVVIQAEIDINVATSMDILAQKQVDRLAEAGIYYYSHNLETAKSYFPQIVTIHTWEECYDTLRMVSEAGMEICCGSILGTGETLEQCVGFVQDLAALNPTEVLMNFLDPRPGIPLVGRKSVPAKDVLRATGAFRLILLKTILRFADGRELTLGGLGTEKGLLDGIDAVIVGNYLTTLGRPVEQDLGTLSKV